MNCKECGQELTEVGEMDEYQLCHPCYCTVMDTTNIQRGIAMKQDIDPSQRSYSWGELADLTHDTQVKTFGWCSCEDNEGNENPYTDCPTKENSND